jgi:glycosyltransferase involved in cell wall biosynthesis
MVVLPSFDEGFGLPALEAMTIGVPVVVSSRGALPEVVGTAGLFIDPDDVAGIASVMQRILTEPGLALRCSEAGVMQSRRFNWEASAARLLEADGAAVERRRSRS